MCNKEVQQGGTARPPPISECQSDFNVGLVQLRAHLGKTKGEDEVGTSHPRQAGGEGPGEDSTSRNT